MVKVLAFIITGVVLEKCVDFAMKKWCDSAASNIWYFYLFFGVKIVNIFIRITKDIYMHLYRSRLGKKIYKKMIKSLLYTSLPHFFNRVTTGKILDRLTRDVRVVHEEMIHGLQGTTHSFLWLIANVVVCIYTSTIWMAVPIIMLVIFIGYKKFYWRKSQLQVERMERMIASPADSVVSTINGLSSIRAYGCERKFSLQQV